MLGRLTDTIGALWVLLTLGIATRFRFNGDYWHWRTHTALDAKGAPEGKLRGFTSRWNMGDGLGGCVGCAD